MADTRQFTDHNEIGGVNVYLEDKKLAESPEQNTVATTDYVLLKDTDGVPHKISKENMMSVVKDALGDLLKNNDLGTSVTKVPALNASSFGSSTVANLASTLGWDNKIKMKKYYLHKGESVNIGANSTWVGLLFCLSQDMVTTIDYYYTFNKDFEGLNLKRETGAGPVTVTFNGPDDWASFVVMLWDHYRL